MKCKLCLLDKPLLKESHIIPDWFYNSLYDPSHSFFEFSERCGKFIKRKKFTGEYESDILCKECDNKIFNERYEDYAHAIFFNNNKLKKDLRPIFNGPFIVDGKQYYRIVNLDYARIKLFFLSMIWRASISDREVFTNVKLGSKEEEALRKMLLLNDPGGEQIFPMAFYTFPSGIKGNQIIVQPTTKQLENHIVTTFVLPDLIILYFIPEEEHEFSDPFINRSCRKDGTLIVEILDKEHFFIQDRNAYMAKIGAG